MLALIMCQLTIQQHWLSGYIAVLEIWILILIIPPIKKVHLLQQSR